MFLCNKQHEHQMWKLSHIFILRCCVYSLCAAMVCLQYVRTIVYFIYNSMMLCTFCIYIYSIYICLCMILVSEFQLSFSTLCCCVYTVLYHLFATKKYHINCSISIYAVYREDFDRSY